MALRISLDWLTSVMNERRPRIVMCGVYRSSYGMSLEEPRENESSRVEVPANRKVMMLHINHLTEQIMLATKIIHIIFLFSTIKKARCST
jgi:hypothetical protein